MLTSLPTTELADLRFCSCDLVCRETWIILLPSCSQVGGLLALVLRVHCTTSGYRLINSPVSNEARRAAMEVVKRVAQQRASAFHEMSCFSLSLV